MPSPVDTSVKFIASWMPGAPQIINTVGPFLSAMDIMATGADPRTGATITVVSGLATITVTGGAHMAVKDAVILIENATDAELDGEQKIITATSGELTFATNATDGVYTGDYMLAPMGWEIAFTGTNKRAYRSLDLDNERLYLRLEQTVYNRATVRVYRAMSDIDTGTGPIPTFDAEPTCYWETRIANTSSPASEYLFVTDGIRMFVWIDASRTATNGGGPNQYFGPMLSRPEIIDPNNTIITMAKATSVVSAGISQHGNTSAPAYISKNYTGIGDYFALNAFVAATGGNSWTPGQVTNWGTSYPDPITGALIHSDIVIGGTSTNASSGGIRGKIPGFQLSVILTTGVFSPGDEVVLNGHRHIAIRHSANSSTSMINTNSSFIDVQGPWV